MKRLCTSTLLMACSLTAFAGGGLDSFLADLNVKAQANLPGFSTTVSTQFHVPLPSVQVVLNGVPRPADAFMIFHLSMLSGRPPEQVMNIYHSHGSKGWGALAQELGIKPGSAEFHALKNGNLHYGNHHERDRDGYDDGPGKEHRRGGHGNGKNKHDR